MPSFFTLLKLDMDLSSSFTRLPRLGIHRALGSSLFRGTLVQVAVRFATHRAK